MSPARPKAVTLASISEDGSVRLWEDCGLSAVRRVQQYEGRGWGGSEERADMWKSADRAADNPRLATDPVQIGQTKLIFRDSGKHR